LNKLRNSELKEKQLLEKIIGMAFLLESRIYVYDYNFMLNDIRINKTLSATLNFKKSLHIIYNTVTEQYMLYDEKGDILKNINDILKKQNIFGNFSIRYPYLGENSKLLYGKTSNITSFEIDYDSKYDVVSKLKTSNGQVVHLYSNNISLMKDYNMLSVYECCKIYDEKHLICEYNIYNNDVTIYFDDKRTKKLQINYDGINLTRILSMKLTIKKNNIMMEVESYNDVLYGLSGTNKYALTSILNKY